MIVFLFKVANKVFCSLLLFAYLKPIYDENNVCTLEAPCIYTSTRLYIPAYQQLITEYQF